MMYLALTYDHRLLDGREAVTLLVKIKVRSSNDVTSIAHQKQEYIEDPRKMLLA